MSGYQPDSTRYEAMAYRRTGASGLLLPALSLGLWQNFGDEAPFAESRRTLLYAFDAGITHFDLANNYGPSPGSAEATVGRLLSSDLKAHRDELVISTKAGHRMWDGPYGEWGSRKYLLASLDQSLSRMGIDYADIFYSHRLDPLTPLDETMGALASAVQQGKALYVGISGYPAEQTVKAASILRQFGVRLLIHQPKYSMLNREPENGLLTVLGREGIGCIAFSPLAQGLLTDRYLKTVPPDSRAGGQSPTLYASSVTAEWRNVLVKLNDVAEARGQTLAQLALAWVLRHPEVTSAIIGVSRLEQLESNLRTLRNMTIEQDDLNTISALLEATHDS